MVDPFPEIAHTNFVSLGQHVTPNSLEGATKLSGRASPVGLRLSDDFDFLSKPISSSLQVREDCSLTVNLCFLTSLVVSEGPAIHFVQRERWPGMLISPFKRSHTQLAQLEEIRPRFPE